ncbi:hypothetical protein CVT25_014331 [Psilocybe cyanescens]|uniref:Uncharacterized protein n=1 Tax=Psilocybe cyanescens TaxID=93625 RepID=A0A409XKZ2_PSICY|nr:hypothetical protein CVT25_014331 [Psilocybe cyanescens]
MEIQSVHNKRHGERTKREKRCRNDRLRKKERKHSPPIEPPTRTPLPRHDKHKRRTPQHDARHIEHSELLRPRARHFPLSLHRQAFQQPASPPPSPPPPGIPSSSSDSDSEVEESPPGGWNIVGSTIKFTCTSPLSTPFFPPFLFFLFFFFPPPSPPTGRTIMPMFAAAPSGFFDDAEEERAFARTQQHGRTTNMYSRRRSVMTDNT